MKRKFFIVMLSALAALTLCLGLAACDIDDFFGDSTAGDEHLVFEQNGDGYTVLGLTEDCTHREIVIPATHEGLPVTEIGPQAFIYIDSIDKVTIPDSVKRIGRYAFMMCTALKEVDLGKGVEVIGLQSFDSCASLEHIELPESLREIDGYAFEYSALQEITVPDGVVRIGGMAFAYCESLAQITLGEGLKDIGAYAFSHIAAEKIVVPDSVTDLGPACFAFNSALKEISFGWGCTGIPYGACHQCTSLETVSIADYCNVSDSAFGDCTALRRIYFGMTEEDWNNYCSVGTESNENPLNGYGNTYFLEADLYFFSEEPNYDGVHWGYDENNEKVIWQEPEEPDAHLIYALNESETAYTVTGLDDACTDTKIVIPAMHEGLPVTKIGRYAFYECKDIEEVVLSSEIVALDLGAFCSCEGLKTINFPKRLRTIGDYAFYGCTSLQEAELPIATREIGICAFEYCAGLERVSIPKYADLGMFAFSTCTSLSELTFEEGFDGLSLYVFAECAALGNVVLPESLTEIDPYAFFQSGLTEIVIPKGVKTIGTCAFSGCVSLAKVTFQEGLRYIEAYAFQETALREVIIPEGVYQIGVQAFAFNEQLEEVILKSVYLASCGYAAFAMCPELKAVTICDPYGNITDTAFAGCEKFDTVYFDGFEDEDGRISWEEFCEERVNKDSFENPEAGYGNKYLCNAPHVYYYSEEPNYDGNHWHFGSDGKPQLWA